MDGTNQPAKLHPRHDVLHAFECFVGAGAVIQQQQNPGEDLDDEEKQRDAAEKVPVRQSMRGNCLVAERRNQSVQMQPLVKPAIERGEHGYASRFRLTTISSPRR